MVRHLPSNKHLFKIYPYFMAIKKKISSIQPFHESVHFIFCLFVYKLRI